MDDQPTNTLGEDEDDPNDEPKDNKEEINVVTDEERPSEDVNLLREEFQDTAVEEEFEKELDEATNLEKWTAAVDDDRVDNGQNVVGSDTSQKQRHWHTDSDEEIESIGSDINICISDTKLENLKQKHTFKQKIQKLLGVHTPMTQKEFDNQIRILYKCCLKSVKDLHELHMRRLIGMQIIEEIITRVKSTNVSMSHVIHITWSIMSCIHHFQLRIRTVSMGPISYARRKKAEKCMTAYGHLIKLFKPEMHRIILNAIITFYREGKLWEIEFACTDLIVQLLQIYQDAEEGIEDILYTLETATLLNVHEAKCLTQVLYEILKKVKWRRMSEYLMIKFLSMLESSILPKPTDHYNYCPLRKGLEICVRNTIGNICNKDLVKLLYFILRKLNEKGLDDETIMCLGNLAAFGAKKFRTKSIGHSILEGPLPLIFRLFQAKNTVLMLLATRIWQSLIDRNNNGLKFLSPRIFLRDCNYGLAISPCRDVDKAFFKSVRHLVYEISLNSFIASSTRMGLENSYQAIALTLIEIPCGYSASCFITVAMSLQEYAFKISRDDLVRSHHLHATVLSLLTLICYIHNATIFYDYVNTIMERRAEWAPHLNPPLKAHYEYAQHHVLWNKPELFFEDWEARYGLWKCFRIKRRDKMRKSLMIP